jgi:hypothetical protein
MKKVLVGLVVALVALGVVVATRPAAYRVERSATLRASPDVVFAQVADFRRWEGWSPWAKLDPQMKTTFEGPASGVGARYAWSGNDQVGAGRMTILEARASELVRLRLEFLEPWQSTASTEFTFTPEGGATRVRWVMSGEHDFLGKAFCLFMDMDRMVGADFEQGLAQLASQVEGTAALPAAAALPR